jgi:general secretion pathway protein J
VLAPAPAALGVTGRSRFRLSVARREGLSDLTMAVEEELAGALSRIEQKTLIAGAASIEFGYFGIWRSEPGPQWRDRWTGQTALPQMLRIQVRFPGGDARPWPDLVIVPRITADVGCVYDQLTQQCRGR